MLAELCTLPLVDKKESAPPSSERVDILNFERGELEAHLREHLSLERFRAAQVTRWLYRYGLRSFDEMSDIAKPVRAALSETYHIPRPSVSSEACSTDGTRKYLFSMPGGGSVESVLICQPARFTLCISSQIGCAIACSFCNTGRMGLIRNLNTSEIVSQVLAVREATEGKTSPTGRALEFGNIVFMGMGEPLHNLDNVIRAVKILNDPLGLDFSSRKITVSTSGLVPAIIKFGQSGAGANLAVSLNATTDDVRTKLIPINKKWPLSTLLGTLRDYPLKKGKRITIEYVMLKDINDSKEDLLRLPKLLHGISCKVNLIPYNDNTGLGYRAPEEQIVRKWQRRLLDRGLNTTIRWSKGQDIGAACGQLWTKAQKNKRLV